MFQSIRKGSAVIDVVMGAAVIVFVILPLFSGIIEKYILLNKVQIIKDAVDMTNISVYNAIDARNLGRETVVLDYPEVQAIYMALLAGNLHLDNNLYPLPQSLAEGPVRIDSLALFMNGFPTGCPNGIRITRPSIHSYISVPVRPSLYRQLILGILGKEFVELKVHVDSDIPVNN